MRECYEFISIKKASINYLGEWDLRHEGKDQKKAIRILFSLRVLHSLWYAAIIFGMFAGCSGDASNPETESSQATGAIQIPQKYDSLKNITSFSAETEAPYEVSFTEEVVFGTGDEIILSGFGSFEVGEDNSVYVSSGRSIVVFDENGTFTKRMGREGRGPGEFKNMVTLNPRYYNEKLLVYDNVLRRVTIFDTNSLSYLESFNIDPKEIGKIRELSLTHLRTFYPYNDSLLIAELEDMSNHDRERVVYKRYYLINFKSEIVSKDFFKYQLNPNNTVVSITPGENNFFPFRNQSDRYTRIYFGQDRNIYLTESEDFLIKVFSMEGEYLRSIYYPIDNASFDKEEAIETFDYNETAYDKAKAYDFPETWPVIDQLIVDDDNRLWVSTITESDSTYSWWILNNDGSLHAKLDWPGKRMERQLRRRIFPKLRNGFFYEVGENDETKDAIITKYKIEFTERE